MISFVKLLDEFVVRYSLFYKDSAAFNGVCSCIYTLYEKVCITAGLAREKKHVENYGILCTYF